jgi:hypothetical protein
VLQQNADEAQVAVEDHQGTDAIRREQLRRHRQINCRFDADDVVTLGGKVVFKLMPGSVKDDFVPSL